MKAKSKNKGKAHTPGPWNISQAAALEMLSALERIAAAVEISTKDIDCVLAAIAVAKGSQL